MRSVWINLDLKKIKKESIGLVWNLKFNFIQNKKTSSAVFFSFLQKRQDRLCTRKFAKICGYKDTSCNEGSTIFQKLKNNKNTF